MIFSSSHFFTADSPWSHHPNNIQRTALVIKLLIMQFSPVPCHFLPLNPNYLPRHHNLKQPQHMFLPQHYTPSFTPTYNSTQNYTSEYFNVLFLESKYYNYRLETADWIALAQDKWRAVLNVVMNYRVPWNKGIFLCLAKEPFAVQPRLYSMELIADITVNRRAALRSQSVAVDVPLPSIAPSWYDW